MVLESWRRIQSFSYLLASFSTSSEGFSLERVLDRLEGGLVSANPDTYAALIRKCTTSKDWASGKRIHAHILKQNSAPSRLLKNLMIQMYGKCGQLDEARQIFEGMPDRNVFSWNILITAYIQHGYRVFALDLFHRMNQEVKPNTITFISILKSLSSSKEALAEGKAIHSQIVRDGCDFDTVVGTSLLMMYSRCGSISDAKNVFDKMSQKNVVCWNAMITAYTHNGHFENALLLYERMEMKPTHVTFLPVLEAVSSLGNLARGKKIHKHIIDCGHSSHIAVENSLITMYGKCRSLENARWVFENMRERDAVSWTSMIYVYSQHGYAKKSVDMFHRMDPEGLKPTYVTYLAVLEACANLKDIAEARKIHESIIQSGLRIDAIVGKSLINMYGKCGNVAYAKKVFNELGQVRDVVCWNVMIAVYTLNGQAKHAVEIFHRMDVIPDAVTFGSVLDACSSMGDLKQGKELHKRMQSIDSSLEMITGNTLVNMYSKCGSMQDAKQVFDKLIYRNEISWTTLITGYSQNGCSKEALKLFRDMDLEGVKPDAVTLVSVLDACTDSAALPEGRKLHSRIEIYDFRKVLIPLRNALINFYTRCGTLAEARLVFDAMQRRDSISWSSIIAASARLGSCDDALSLLQEMDWEGMEPDEVTFTSILSACSHGGHLQEATAFFVSMMSDHGIVPERKHYVCMIDLLARTGRLLEAEDVIVNMPCQAGSLEWMTLLGASTTHGNVEKAEQAAQYLFKIGTKISAPYVQLSNIYQAH